MSTQRALQAKHARRQARKRVAREFDLHLQLVFKRVDVLLQSKLETLSNEFGIDLEHAYEQLLSALTREQENVTPLKTAQEATARTVRVMLMPGAADRAAVAAAIEEPIATYADAARLLRPILEMHLRQLKEAGDQKLAYLWPVLPRLEERAELYQSVREQKRSGGPAPLDIEDLL
jgi:hypothetical protein